MPWLRKALLGWVIVCVSMSLCRARTIVVDGCRGAGDYTTIQEAIDNAATGDVVEVRPCTYLISAPISFLGKAITVKSSAGPAETMVRMSDLPADQLRASVFVFENGEPPTARLEGFTIIGGQGTFTTFGALFGGGIYIWGSAQALCSPTIQDNVIAGNSAENGGGIATYYSASTISGNELVDNYASTNGGGIWSYYSALTIQGNTFLQNIAVSNGGGISWGYSATGSISQNFIVRNETEQAQGGGVFLIGYSNIELVGNTITQNFAGWVSQSTGQEGGGGISIYPYQVSQPTIRNTIVWGNSTLANCPNCEPEIYGWQWCTFSYCDLNTELAIPGEGIITDDPLFVNPSADGDPRNGDFCLAVDSPCIDAGDPAESDPDGTRVDIGVYCAPALIAAIVNLSPDTLNLKSRGRYATGHITLPEGFNVNNIDTATVAIVEIDGSPASLALDPTFAPVVEDYDEDGIADLTVKFDRQALISLLTVGKQLVCLEGKLLAGNPFRGCDQIRVISRGK